ncbi:5-deoxy-glucuronate isomerase [Deinococcus sp. KSM4-11]|uniref:5-deoxy-glucuronate isomerase n=1 Tax=Deinococcus sp. KSM4-11 TaxID=2568654 RepID=UPI0010A379CD|nr:5-deoxy-glucuronate isomerase [Deinococcus sp. KSM4-11]THF86988.1 5-deoxy-glucuronate isomerase [Deinococcus sp. KSM4-11]
MTGRTQLRPGPDGGVSVTPESAGWRYLSSAVETLKAGETRTFGTGGQEVAVVLQNGAVTLQAGGQDFDLRRPSVFEALPHLLYVPPGTAWSVTAHADSTVAHGGAPAEGRLPLRLFCPEEMRVEMRGGANATRQVTHLLGPDLPAERLLLYEVYTPSGHWSGWPPHRHDGQLGSLYIEETYLYRVQPETGWAIHRNYSPEDDYDEALVARDGDLILAPRGYHPVAAAPGSNVYYLNFMAGDAVGEQRRTPPVDEADWAWMRQDWGGRPLPLPLGGAPRTD